MQTQNRQPPGVPAGGQFAATQHAEAGVVLVEHDSMFAPASPADRATGVELDPSWRPGDCFLAGDAAQVQAGLRDYDQWQVRVAVLGEAVDEGDIGAGEELDDLNDEMNYLVHRLVDASTPPRPDVRPDTSWRPESVFSRHQSADGPSLDELVTDYDQWQHRVEELSAEDSMEEVDDLNSDMRYLVHEIAHRLKLQSESASAA